MFGDRLKRLLILRNMTQREFAKKIGITECAISRYIQNERKPNYEILVKICKTLNISADWLLGLIGE